MTGPRTGLETADEMLAVPMLDAEGEIARIAAALRAQAAEVLKRRGFVVAMSGGVDSSVCVALAVRAVGAKRVFGLFMPDRDSDPRSLGIATEWAERLGIECATQDITPVLEAAGCYRDRLAVIRGLIPEFGPDWRFKIALPGGRDIADRLNVYSLVVESPEGDVRRIRMPSDVYRTIVAATNYKQRVRKMIEYFHADRLHYAVVGTPNRLEYDQGFFVKGGDGLADVKPIAHLYKTQVYQLAEALGVPHAVTDRAPTTDTYSLPQTQDEFYFHLPVAEMDRVLHAHRLGLSPAEAAGRLGMEPAQVEAAYRDLVRKRATTRYLHMQPLLVEPVETAGGA